MYVVGSASYHFRLAPRKVMSSAAASLLRVSTVNAVKSGMQPQTRSTLKRLYWIRVAVVATLVILAFVVIFAFDLV